MSDVPVSCGRDGSSNTSQYAVLHVEWQTGIHASNRREESAVESSLGRDRRGEGEAERRGRGTFQPGRLEVSCALHDTPRCAHRRNATTVASSVVVRERERERTGFLPAIRRLLGTYHKVHLRLHGVCIHIYDRVCTGGSVYIYTYSMGGRRMDTYIYI